MIFFLQKPTCLMFPSIHLKIMLIYDFFFCSDPIKISWNCNHTGTQILERPESVFFGHSPSYFALEKNIFLSSLRWELCFSLTTETLITFAQNLIFMKYKLLSGRILTLKVLCIKLLPIIKHVLRGSFSPHDLEHSAHSLLCQSHITYAHVLISLCIQLTMGISKVYSFYF